MKRSTIAFLVVLTLSAALSAATFADGMATTSATQGWLKAAMQDSWPSVISADAQKEVGMTVDQLKTDMGPTNLTESDGSGGTYYFYRIDIAGSNGYNVDDVWFDVDSSGKIIKVIS